MQLVSDWGVGVLEQFEKELKEYVRTKGTMHFPLDKPLPDALVKKIVKARIAQNKVIEAGDLRRVFGH